jgi:hypothetical protein
MLHACLYTIFFVFCYTSWCFYAFSGTNLLTRCHSVSSLFLLFLCFRKATQEIFSKLDETKVEVPNYLTWRQSPKMRQRGGRGSPHPKVARPRPWPRHQGVSLPGPHPDDALLPISSPRWKNLRDGSLFHEIYCKPSPSSSRDREDPGAIPDTLSEAFSTTMDASGVMCE